MLNCYACSDEETCEECEAGFTRTYVFFGECAVGMGLN